MTELVDATAARGSNAGDRYHQLWAVSHFLDLVQPRDGYSGMTVEGLTYGDEKKAKKGSFEAIDCARFFDGTSVDGAGRIIVEQLKYSTTGRAKNWTLSELTAAKNQKRDNSIIGQLAKAFDYYLETRPELVADGGLTLRFLSNRNVSKVIIDALGGKRPSDLNKIKSASKIKSEAKFVQFCAALDFDHCGDHEQGQLRETSIKRLEEWFDQDALTEYERVLNYVVDMMLPTSRRLPATQDTVLGVLGYGDKVALFPCQSEVSAPENEVQRDLTNAEFALSKHQFVCFHGGAGIGKTTFVQQLASQRERNSPTIIFDCYGSGSYLNSDLNRHRPKEAFTQVCNEISNLMEIPIYIGKQDGDHVKKFSQRLQQASEALIKAEPQAKLLIVFDAVDNSVRAAKEVGVSDDCFVSELFAMSSPPSNIQIVVTCRTGNLSSVNLPSHYERQMVPAFAEAETEDFVNKNFGAQKKVWIREFHELSAGTPRVQNYAAAFSKGDPDRGLKYLKPNGKDLDGIFASLFSEASAKAQSSSSVPNFCASLIALPRPIPIEHLSKVVGGEELHVLDLVADLSPAIRIIDNGVSFYDEDFEAFVRTQGEDHIENKRLAAVKLFRKLQESDEYSAQHLGRLLFDLEEYTQLTEIAERNETPVAISDPVRRTLVQQERLGLALRACHYLQDSEQALRLAYVASEARKTEGAVGELLVENVRIASLYSPNNLKQEVLYSSGFENAHGKVLIHLAARAARNGDSVTCGQLRNRFNAWLDRYNREHANDNDYVETRYELSVNEIQSAIEIRYYTESLSDLYTWLVPNSGSRNAVSAYVQFVSELLTKGQKHLVARMVKCRVAKQSVWRLVTEVLLSTSDPKYVPKYLLVDSEAVLKSGLVDFKSERQQSTTSRNTLVAPDYVMTGLEAWIGRVGVSPRALSALRKLCPKKERALQSNIDLHVNLYDRMLRAHCLLQAVSNSSASLDTFLIDPTIGKTKSERKKSRRDDDDNKKSKHYIEMLLPIYQARSKVILTCGNIEADIQSLAKSLGSISHKRYSQYRYLFEPEMRRRCVVNCAWTMASITKGRDVLVAEIVENLDASWLGQLEHEISSVLVLDENLHEQIFNLIAPLRQTVLDTRTSSLERISSLMKSAKLLWPFMPDEGAGHFEDAIRIAGDVDESALTELRALSTMLRNGCDFTEGKNTRLIATNIVIYAADTFRCLDGYEKHFPWGSLLDAVVRIDFPLALAASLRWEDSHVISSDRTLDHVISSGLKTAQLSARQAASLLPLLERPNNWIHEEILLNSTYDEEVLEEIARKIVLYSEPEIDARECRNIVEQIADDNFLPFSQILKNWYQFNQSIPRPKSNSYDPMEPSLKGDPLDQISFESVPVESHEKLSAFIAAIKEQPQCRDRFVTTGSILSRISQALPLGKRVLYLNSLVRLSEEPFYFAEDLFGEWSSCLKRWGNQKSVIDIIPESLAMLIREQPELMSYACYVSREPFLHVLSLVPSPNKKIVEAIFETFNAHNEHLSYDALVYLNALAISFSDLDEQQRLATFITTRLKDRIPETERDVWYPDDAPITVKESIGRALYATMSDLFTPTRWLGAHSVRSLGRLDLKDELACLINCYSLKAERVYRRPDAAFYWNSARQMLLVALNRMASENADSLVGHVDFLARVALSDAYPHFLIREEAKSAVLKLHNEKTLAASSGLGNRITPDTNRSPLGNVRPSDDYADKHMVVLKNKRPEERFDFDTMDTFRYWYRPVAELLEKVDGEQFLNCAEKWIIDEFKGDASAKVWVKERRRDRLRENMGTGNRHGNLPVAERYQTHQEWHGLWCAFGEALQNHRVLWDSDNPNGFGTLSYAVQLYTSTTSDVWASDTRTLPPLFDVFWSEDPRTDEEARNWCDELQNYDWLSHILPNGHDGEIVIAHYTDFYHSDITQDISVQSALVSPESALELCEVLEHQTNSFDVGLPHGEDHPYENLQAPFMLLSTTDTGPSFSEFEIHDPSSMGLRSYRLVPSHLLIKELQLDDSKARNMTWNGKNNDIQVRYEHWSNSPVNRGDGRHRHDPYRRISGGQLSITNLAIVELLKETKLDLVFCVKIERQKKDRQYSFEETDKKLPQSTKWQTFIFRQSGEIENHRGYIGSWLSNLQTAAS